MPETNIQALEIHAESEHQRALDVLRRRTKADVKNQIAVMYGSGSKALSPTQQAAVAMVTWNMGLDPSPGTGHLYAWTEGGRFNVQIGYRGWLFKAEQYYSFVYKTRPMTPDERQAHHLKDNKVGAVCELYEKKRIQLWTDMGLPIEPIVGIGVVEENHTPPNGRTVLWVAEKRATVDALRHLGLGFGPMQIPQMEGMTYDHETDTYSLVEETAPIIIEGQIDPPTPPQEGEEKPVVENQPKDGDDNAPVATQDAPKIDEAANHEENTAAKAKASKFGERPYSFATLKTVLQTKAATMKDEKSLGQITKQKLTTIIIRLAELVPDLDKDSQAKFFHEVFGVASRSALTNGQGTAFIQWANTERQLVVAEVEHFVDWLSTQTTPPPSEESVG